MPNNSDNLDLLLSLLGKSSSAPPKNAGREELNKYIMDSLSGPQRDLLKKLAGDPSAADEFLKSPQAREIIKKLKKDG